MKKLLKYIVVYTFMIACFAFATFITLGLIFYGLDLLIDWIFGISYANYMDYYFDKIFVSGPMWFRYFKVWLIGIPLTYLINIRESGWKIKD